MAGAGAGPIDSGSNATPDQPQDGARVESLDLIRGFAVMGIVIANVTSLGALSISYTWPVADGPISLGEKIVWLLQYIFVDGKLRGVFALLFGVGIAIFLERAKAKGAAASWLQLRRLFWLLLFGLAHYFLLFTGDILHDYAMAGVVALLFMWVRPKWLFGIAALVFVAYTAFPTIALNGFREFEQAALSAPEGAEVRSAYEDEVGGELEQSRAYAKVLAGGSLPEIVRHRWENNKFSWVEYPERWLPEYTLLMLMGAALYRMGFFAKAAREKRYLWFGIGGVAISALASLGLGLWAVSENFPRALTMFVFYGPVYLIRLPMILGYIALLAVLATAILQTGLGGRVAAAGRMAFTNYVGTSLVAALFFQGWSLGLYDKFDKVERLWFVVLVWALMLVCSKPWLERFRFGPLEWAWRCLTYWQVFPIKREGKS